MPIDPYSPCPGGTGKKLKFCCSDLVQELDKLQRMLEGEQASACLDAVRKLDEKYPGRACLQSMRVQLETALGDAAAAESTLAAFLKQHPENPIARSEKALHTAAQGDPLGAIIWLQQAIEACGTEMPSQVYDAIGALALVLLQGGHVVPARAHLQLQLGLSQGRDERAVSTLLQLEGSPTIPVLLKNTLPFEPAPAKASWEAPFQAGLNEAHHGHWKKAVDQWTALASQAGSSPAFWRNLATLHSFLGNYAEAVDALRKFAALEVPADDAVEAEALAQLLAKDEAEGHVDEISLTYNLDNGEAAQEKFAADRRFERLPLDTRPWTEQNEPPPRAAFSLLSRPALASGKEITPEQIPNQLGQLLLFGKQTDREARLELLLFRPELPTAQKLLQETLGDGFGPPSAETVIGHLGQTEHALSWHWRLPDDTPEALRLKLGLEQRQSLVLNRWPKLPLPIFGGRTPEQAATEPQYRTRLQAAILLLQLSDADSTPDTYNQLRRNFKLPELGDLNSAGLDMNQLPLNRMFRLQPESLSDEQLQQAFNRAVVANFALALKRLAPEVVQRPNIPVPEYKLSAYRWLVRTAPNSTAALQIIDEARKLAEAHKQSSASWDLLELSLRIQLGDGQTVLQLIDHIQRQHAREPGVAQALVQLLMQFGLITPDGRLAVGAAPPAAAGASAATPLVVPGAAAEPGKLWTPDAPQATGEKKSALWLPD
ncbi:MAG TPA: tetratricopeptide repeat protein [Pirellulales bacterium]|jgi:tetratricopeptide (TPR) repeat protein|nr:tetratricopeptide repeat protein [Pirellulales bacterium]